MEFFNKAKVVRLRSHLDKYLIADENEETVRQSRNATSRKAQWAVEFPEGQNHIIRLKSCYGRYLTASDEPFLLGVTGKKVIQTVPATNMNTSIEWEPIKEGFFVKLRTKSSGKFLRANGGTPPWRNTVTHDVPHRTATQDWVLWDVDVIDVSLSACESLPSYVSPVSSFSSSIRSLSIVSDGSGHSSFSSSRDDIADSKARSLSIVSNRSAQASGKQNGMVFFDKVKAVRLESHFGKYLVADEDEETVRQSRSGSSNKARWTVEFIEGKNHLIRLKSCHGLYLTASDEPFLLGMTGKKVLQTSTTTKTDASIEWEPIKEGLNVKLRTRDGKFLRANGGTPPWRNSITHDVPHRTATQDWVLWGVDVVDICISDHVDSLSRNISSASSFSSSVDDFTGSPDTGSPSVVSGGRQLNDSGSPVKSEGRIIYYSVVDDDDGKIEEGKEEPSFHFKGLGLEELTEKLEEETGLEDVIVCLRNPWNGKLSPLRLDLPPNNTTMHIVVVPSSSKAASEFAPDTSTS
ncbi:hypothetical protein CsSME_00004323 [Camellia sinensis var. sinensis]